MRQHYWNRNQKMSSTVCTAFCLQIKEPHIYSKKIQRYDAKYHILFIFKFGRQKATPHRGAERKWESFRFVCAINRVIPDSNHLTYTANKQQIRRIFFGSHKILWKIFVTVDVQHFIGLCQIVSSFIYCCQSMRSSLAFINLTGLNWRRWISIFNIYQLIFYETIHLILLSWTMNMSILYWWWWSFFFCVYLIIERKWQKQCWIMSFTNQNKECRMSTRN